MAIEFIHSLEVAGDLTVDGVISKSDGGSSTQWDAAYNWGNHADAGYLDSDHNHDARYLKLSGGTITSADTVGLTINHNTFDKGLILERKHDSNAASIKFKNTTSTQGTLFAISNDNSLYWRHGIETDNYKLWTAKDFSETDVANGVTAYGWSNHADAGYIKTIPRTYGNATTILDRAIEFHDNGGDLSWIVGADDRGGVGTPGQNAFVIRTLKGTRFPQDTTWNSKGTEVFGIDDSGNVGINVAQADYIERVNIGGNISVTGSIKADGYKPAEWDAAYTFSTGTHAPTDAEKNVQSDWTEATTTSDAFILNKPSIITTGHTNALFTSLDDVDDNRVDSQTNYTEGPHANHSIVMTLKSAASSGRRAQLFFGDTSAGGMHLRLHQGGEAWHPWKKVWTSNEFSSDDVANGVTAHGWGNHADEDYLTALPSHNHDGSYLKLNPRLRANADTITQSGIHIWDVSEATDDPEGASDGLLTTKFWDSSGWAVQSYHDFHHNKLYIRSKQSSKWQDKWAQVHTTDSFTTSDVEQGQTAYGWGNHADAGYVTTDNDTIFNGGNVDNPVVIDNTSANCVLHWSDSGDSTGAVKIKLPGFHSKSNWSMLVMRVTLYEYTSDAHTIYTVSGHDWTSGWYNKRIKKHGESAKNLKYAYSTSADEDYLILGETDSAFKYAHVTVDVIAHPGFYHGAMDLSSGWEISQVTSLDGVTEQASTNEKVIDTANPSVANWDTAYGWGNHADAGYITSIPINSKYIRSDVDDEATGKINFAYQVADFNDINGGLGVTPFKGAFQAKNRPGSGNYATGLEFTYHDSQARTQFAAASSGNNNTGELYVRSEKWGSDKVWSDWWKILHTGNSNTSNWDTAYGWGNHADGGYLTSYSETSDLESVRARDNSIGGVINFTPDTGDILQVDGQVILKRTTANGGITIGHDDAVIIAGGDTSGTLNSNINNAEETVFIGAEGGLKVFAFPDNMSGGWAARKEWRFQNDGDTDFPGKLYPSGGSTHYVDSTRISNWQTAYGWGDHSIRGYLTRSKPESPKILSQIVGETIEVTITASSTSNIDQYLIFSSVVGSDFGLISVIPPDDFAEEMSVIDDSFDEGGKIEYRVYAVKQGVYSDVATTSQDFSVGELEPTNLSVVDLNNAKYIQWDAPSSKKRFVGVYNVYHHEHDTQASLLRSSASLIYSGTNTSYMKPTSNNKFHQFWVEITES